MKHTPAPWKFKPNYDNRLDADIEKDGIAGTIRSESGWNIARIWQLSESSANAQLISAAPELLAACKNVLDIINSYQHIPAQFKACQMLQDVIKKAEE